MAKINILVLSLFILTQHIRTQTCASNCAKCIYSNGYHFCSLCYKSINTKGTCDTTQTNPGCVLNEPNGGCYECSSTYVSSIEDGIATCRATSRCGDPLCNREEKQSDGSWKCLRCRRSVPTADGKCTHFFPDDQRFDGCNYGGLTADGVPDCVLCLNGYYAKFKSDTKLPRVCSPEQELVYKGCRVWNLYSMNCEICDSENGYFKLRNDHKQCTNLNPSSNRKADSVE